MKTIHFKKSTLIVGGALFLTWLIAMIAKVKQWATKAATSTVKKIKSTVARKPTTKKSLKLNEVQEKSV
jgi:hypothetical protein